MMQINTRLLPFVITAVIELIGEATGNLTFIQITKPLLMPTLALWWYYSTSGKSVPWRNTVLGALLFSTAGDILLMKSGQYPLFFLLGLSAFLVAHLFYIRTYLTIGQGRRGFLHQNPMVIGLFALYLGGLLLLLWQGIPDGMKAPVAIYALVITVLFVLSDSLIALNKFGFAFPDARVAIMGTYIFGQYAVVRGLNL
jgi:uncharacterized membrane protein YhhN